jgi:hypothetical protein
MSHNIAAREGGWLLSQRGRPRRTVDPVPRDAKTKEPTSWQTLTASVAPLLTPLSNLSDLPVKWGISKQDVDVGEQDLDTKSKDGRFSCQLENSRFFGLLITSAISSNLDVAEQPNWVLSPSLYDFVDNNIASTQIFVQCFQTLLRSFRSLC